MPLADYGLEWVHGDAPLAHPLDDGTAVTIERDLAANDSALGADGKSWRRLVAPAALHWQQFAADILAPPLRVPHHPLRMARFGLSALQSAQFAGAQPFFQPRARAVFAGLAAHSFLSLDRALTAGIGTDVCRVAACGGLAQSRAAAPAPSPTRWLGYLESLGGVVHTSTRIDAAAFRELSRDGALMMCDLTPRQLLDLAGDQLTLGHRLALADFRYGPGAFKVDYALSEPVPWRAPECRRAITVHLGGTFEEIAASESEVAQGRAPERPSSWPRSPRSSIPRRAPRNQHVLWTYCHVPNSSPADMTARIEAQIERFAPGFRDCILARRVSTPAQLEAMDANLVGGDIAGGAISMSQLLFRPTLREYATSNPKIFLCSASTPPGAGVHGMCGYHAAKMALRRRQRIQPA